MISMKMDACFATEAVCDGATQPLAQTSRTSFVVSLFEQAAGPTPAALAIAHEAIWPNTKPSHAFPNPRSGLADRPEPQ